MPDSTPQPTARTPPRRSQEAATPTNGPTTTPTMRNRVYWTLIGIAGLGLLAFTLGRGVSAPRARLLAVVLTALVAVAFFFSYTAVGALAF